MPPRRLTSDALVRHIPRRGPSVVVLVLGLVLGFASPQVEAQVTASDLVAWWELNDQSDSAPAGTRPLLLLDGAALVGDGGETALSLQTDPSNNRAVTTAFNPVSSFSVVIDFQAASLPSGGVDPQYILLSNIGNDAVRTFGQFSASPGYQVYLRANLICVFQKTAFSFTGAQGGCRALPDPTGRHRVVVNWSHSGGQFASTLYLDGSASPLAFAAGPMNFSGGATTSLMLGTNVDEAFQAPRTLHGLVYEAAIFTGTLSAEQVDAVAAGGVAALLVAANQPPVLSVGVNPLVLEGNAPGGYDTGGELTAGAAGVSATDPDGDEVTLTNDAPAVLPLGDSTVTWTATDPDGATDQEGQVARVQDTTGPSVTYPDDIEEEAPTAAGATVTFAVSASDIVDPAPAVACLPASGSTFPIGTTAVTCEASDASGNATTVAFDVTLTLAPPPPPPPPPTIDFDTLIAKIEGMDLPRGIRNALLAKAQAAARAHDRGNLDATVGPLGALLNQVNALDGRQLTADQGDTLRACVTALLAALTSL